VISRTVVLPREQWAVLIHNHHPGFIDEGGALGSDLGQHDRSVPTAAAITPLVYSYR
jgi:hypothetical protein